MECGLIGQAVTLAYGARTAGGTAACHATGPVGAAQIGLAPIHVIAVGKRIDGAGGFAGAAFAGIARTRPGADHRVARLPDCAPERHEKPRIFMHKKPNGRRPAAPAFQRPVLKRGIGRPAEGKDGRAVVFGRDGVDHPGRPAIQRVGGAIAIFRAGTKNGPEMWFVRPDQRDDIGAVLAFAQWAQANPAQPVIQTHSAHTGP